MKRYHNKLIVGVDAGNFNCKTQTQCFTSGYVELAGNEIRYDDMLEYNGRIYALTSNRIPLRDDKTEDDDFFILTLFAMAKEMMQHKVDPGQYSVVLGTGLPPGHLTISGLMERTAKYYNRKVGFRYNGKKFELDIEPIVCPQGFSALLAPVLSDEMQAMKNAGTLGNMARPIDLLVKEPQAILIDIGGGTTEQIPLEFGVPQPSIQLSVSEGIVDAYNEIGAVIKSKNGRDVPESAINLFLNGKEGVRIADADAQIIRSNMDRHSGRFLKKLMESKLPYSSSYNMLMGGGSGVYKSIWENFRDYFGKLDFIQEIRINAIGFEEYALKALMRA